MGGADPLGYTARLLEALVEQRPDYRWIAVCTHSFLGTHLQKLRLLEAQHKNITLLFHLAAPEMHRLMLSSEKAIVSASTVLLEAWASGLYAAAICYTSNQAFIYQGAVSQGMAFGIDINQPESGVLKYLDTKGTSGSRTAEWNPPQHILKAFLRLAYA
jgi:spore coat polysaccharide biosynthesis predicted glycosyltransferase SpsG